MRITNKVMQNNALSNINRNKVLQDDLNNQIATGKKIMKPSDDPVVAIRALRLRSDVSQVNQYYEKNIPDAQAWLSLTESSLKTTISVVKDTVEQCEKGASDQLTTSDRDKIIDSLKALRDEIYKTGDADYAGRYIFTGYRTDTSLSFGKDTTRQYEITETFNFDDCEAMTYVDTANLNKITEANYDQSASAIAETDINNLTYYRFRLAYDSLGDENGYTDGETIDLFKRPQSTDPEAKAAAGGIPATVTIMTDADAAYKAVSADGAENLCYLIPSTGELVMSKDVYNAINNLPESEKNLNISYKKSSWQANDLRPEHYFYCVADPSSDTMYSKLITEQQKLVDALRSEDASALNSLKNSEDEAVKKAATEAAAYLASKSDSTAAIDAQQDVVTNLTNELNELKANVTAAQAELDTATAATNTAQNDYDTAKASVDAAQKEVDEAQAAVDAAQAALDGANANITSLTAAIAELESKITSLTAEIADMDDDNPDKASKQAELTAVTDEKNAKQDELAAENAGLTDKNTTLTDAQTALSEKQTALGTATTNADLPTKQSALDAAKATQAEKEQALADAKSARDAKQAELTDAEKILNTLQSGSSATVDKAYRELLSSVEDSYNLKIEYNPDYRFNLAKSPDQRIEYQVGFDQSVQVNTYASDVYKHAIGRDVDEIIQLAEKVTKAEEMVKKFEGMQSDASADQSIVEKDLAAAKKAETYLKDQLQKTFSKYITKSQGYLDDANEAVTTTGNRDKRVSLAENRLSEQQSTFKTLQSNNEDADATEVAVQLSSAEVSYEAALMATSKMIQSTLLNYL